MPPPFVSDQVEVGADPRSGQGDVPSLAIQGVGAEDEGPSNRRSLRLVNGCGVAEAEMTGVQVGGRQDDAAVVDSRHLHAAGVLVDVSDGGPCAVADAEATVVSQRQHLVADSELTAGHVQRLAVEQAGVGQVLAGPTVEVVDVRTPEGVDGALLTADTGLPPILDQASAGTLGVARHGEPVAAKVVPDRDRDVAGAQLGQGGSFPVFQLTAVVNELGHGNHARKCAERSAGFDLGQLASVADENDLRLVSLGQGNQPGEFAGPDHAAFVHDDDATGRQPAAGARVFGVEQETVQGGGGDPSTGLKLGRSARREGGPDDAPTRRFPSVSGGVEGVGLPGTSTADDDLDTRARGGEPLDHLPLLRRQGRSDGQCGHEGRGIGDTHTRGDSLAGPVEQLPLNRQQFGGAVTLVAQPGRFGEDHGALIAE
jgi:hypothetical protein